MIIIGIVVIIILLVIASKLSDIKHELIMLNHKMDAFVSPIDKDEPPKDKLISEGLVKTALEYLKINNPKEYNNFLSENVDKISGIYDSSNGILKLIGTSKEGTPVTISNIDVGINLNNNELNANLISECDKIK